MGRHPAEFNVADEVARDVVAHRVLRGRPRERVARIRVAEAAAQRDVGIGTHRPLFDFVVRCSCDADRHFEDDNLVFIDAEGFHVVEEDVVVVDVDHRSANTSMRYKFE